MEREIRDGTLTREEFIEGAQIFAKKWERISSPVWRWNIASRPHSSVADGYLSMDHIRRDTFSTTPEIEATANEEIDAASLIVERQDSEARFYNFHVVYCDSYRVPVLYFRGYSSDGEPLVIKEIEEDFPACTAKELAKSKWTFVTLEEHPYLHKPWFKFHPCGTTEWMKLLNIFSTSGVGYLVSWLSVVGQFVDLSVPLKMATEHAPR